MNDKVRTYSGALVGWDGPVPPLRDFLVQLGRIVRFGGATTQPWTVLQHSLVCYRIAESQGDPIENKLAALLHDFGEILIGDIQKPVKWDGYHNLERGFVEMITAAWGLPIQWDDSLWDIVKEIDGLAVNLEGFALTIDFPLRDSTRFIEVEGLLNSVKVASYTRAVDNLDSLHALDMPLTDKCYGTTCSAGQTCVRGSCKLAPTATAGGQNCEGIGP